MSDRFTYREERVIEGARNALDDLRCALEGGTIDDLLPWTEDVSGQLADLDEAVDMLEAMARGADR